VAFASALSQHPLTAHAVGEVAGALLEAGSDRPDLMVVFVTSAHWGALEDVVGALDALLHPLVLLGCSSTAVIGPHLEVARTAGIAALAGSTGPVLPFRAPGGDPGWPSVLPFTPSAAVVLADPFTFAAEPFFRAVTEGAPGCPVLGCFPSSGGGPGTARLALGGSVVSDGGVGVLLGPATHVDGVVAQGGRAFGRPLVVTRATGNLVLELAGRPALERLVQEARHLDPAQVERIEHGGLALGQVVREGCGDAGAADIVQRAVLGRDRASGGLVVGEPVAVGTTVLFHLRDAEASRSDLDRALLGREAEAALLFVGEDRAVEHAAAGHDVAATTRALGPAPLAGCWATATLGPVGDRNFVHDRSVSLALLHGQR
jgi:small ligand-binding sensory domain FIST